MNEIIKYGENQISLSKVKRDVLKIKSQEISFEKSRETPTIIRMKKEIGEEKLIALLQLFIIDAMEFFNVKEKMTNKQVEETAEWILNDFGNIHLSEIIFIFEQAKKGKYGEMYNMINGSKIYQWFEQYWNQRLDYYEQKHISNAVKVDPFERTSLKKDQIFKDIFVKHLKSKK